MANTRTNVNARCGIWFKEWPSFHADAVNFKNWRTIWLKLRNMNMP